MRDGAVPVRLALVLLILPRLGGAPEESLKIKIKGAPNYDNRSYY